MDTDVARIPSAECDNIWSAKRSRVLGVGVGNGWNSREVCDSKGRILVEVLRLDEALKQVPAHGGWRWRAWVLWCGVVGMGIWACLLLPVALWRCDDCLDKGHL